MAFNRKDKSEKEMQTLWFNRGLEVGKAGGLPATKTPHPEYYMDGYKAGRRQSSVPVTRIGKNDS